MRNLTRGLVCRLASCGLLLAATVANADYSIEDIVTAARQGDGHAVHKLLELSPAAAAARDGSGYTALHWAGIRGHWRIFRELVAAGAPVNATGNDGGTPLHWACHHDRADMVELLIDAGADVQVHNQWGRTPLHVAARRGCRAVAALLLARDADANALTTEGWSPLHVAYMSGHQALVELLLAGGAEPSRKDNDGRLPHERAQQRPAAAEIAQELLDDYTGIYDLGNGFTIKVWQADAQLHLREFAPDDLYPTGRDQFFCRSEPWQVSFTRDPAGTVVSIKVDFLRRSVSGQRRDQPHYIGSQACRGCHLGNHRGAPFVTWLRSRHAHAWWRLGADWALFLGRLRPHYQDLETPLEDQRCLLCHVTGAQDENAIFAASFRREEGIGCESCHGPGSAYSDPDVMSDRSSFLAHGGIIPDHSTCRQCHRNSERFDYAEWWPKVAHQRPQETPVH